MTIKMLLKLVLKMGTKPKEEAAMNTYIHKSLTCQNWFFKLVDQYSRTIFLNVLWTTYTTCIWIDLPMVTKSIFFFPIYIQTKVRTPKQKKKYSKVYHVINILSFSPSNVTKITFIFVSLKNYVWNKIQAALASWLILRCQPPPVSVGNICVWKQR